jgi:hypothetical protein
MPAALATLAVGAYSVNRSNKAASNAAEASTQAANTQAASEQEALDYLKQTNALPMELRDQALRGLGSYYQVPGAPKSQDQMIQEAYNSPLYKAIIHTADDAVDQQARYASATGGFRSGNAQMAFAREGQRVSNDALLQSFNQVQGNDQYERALQLQGLSGLAGLDTGENGIANLTAQIGATRGQGIVAAGQARQQGTQNSMNNLLGLGSIFAQGVGSGAIKI